MGNDFQKNILISISAEPNKKLTRFKEAIAWPDLGESIFEEIPFSVTDIASSWIPICVATNIQRFWDNFEVSFKRDDKCNGSYKLTEIRTAILQDVLNIGLIRRDLHLGLIPRYVDPVELDKCLVTPTTYPIKVIGYMMKRDSLVLHSNGTTKEFNINNTSVADVRVQGNSLYYYDIIFNPANFQDVKFGDLCVHVVTVANNPNRFFEHIMVIYGM